VAEVGATDERGDRVGALRAALVVEHRRLVVLRRAVSGDGLDDLEPAVRGRAAAERNPADAAAELEDRERDRVLLGQLDRELRDVDDAIARLDRGEYGSCDVCGASIGAARLAALPATRFCVRHQVLAVRRLERTEVSGGSDGRESPPRDLPGACAPAGRR